MARFATGKKAKAICERCGFTISYLALQTEWNGLRVCNECFEVKHPQLTPRSAFDAQELYQPRPGQHSREDVRIFMRHGVTATFNFLGGIQEKAEQYPEATGVAITSALGTESLTATVAETGFAITTGVGSISSGIAVTGVAITSALGNESLSIDNGGWNVDTWGHGLWGDPQ
tara:strand:- start:1113 stop:1631 length:519 start_codon:yes stop_codon:yes gene_type:complete